MTAPVTTPTVTPKPGYTTTEFWVTLLGVVLSFGLAVAALFDAHPNTAAVNVAIGAAAPLAALIGGAVYAWSRSKVKVAVAAAVVAPAVTVTPSGYTGAAAVTQPAVATTATPLPMSATPPSAP